jgi:small subunit ribosomal protein S7
MSRRGNNKQIKVQPDPVYKNFLVSKLINRSMRDGKKSVAEKEIYQALEIIKTKLGDPMQVFNDAMEKVKPTMEVRPRRIGGAAYQVPMSVRGPRRDSLAIRWIVTAARARSNSEYHTYAEKIAQELIDAANGEGMAYKKKTEMEKVAEANRAFAHFKW